MGCGGWVSGSCRRLWVAFGVVVWVVVRMGLQRSCCGYGLRLLWPVGVGVGMGHAILGYFLGFHGYNFMVVICVI